MKDRFRKTVGTQGIIRGWTSANDIKLQRWRAPVRGFYRFVDDPAVCCGRAGDVERRGAFGDRLAEIAWVVGAAAEFAAGRGLL